MLVMTATPIPRTAAMTVYGDLDVSVLDELPPGRTPIVTRWAGGPLLEAEAWAAVRDEVAAGRQAYVVCPLIELLGLLDQRAHDVGLAARPRPRRAPRPTPRPRAAARRPSG